MKNYFLIPNFKLFINLLETLQANFNQFINFKVFINIEVVKFNFIKIINIKSNFVYLMDYMLNFTFIKFLLIKFRFINSIHFNRFNREINTI